MVLTTEPRLLGTLVDMTSPEAVVDEVSYLFRDLWPQVDLSLFDMSSRTVVDLYRGDYPGYLACNVGFHDLKHTTDIVLAMMRLVHGAAHSGIVFRPRRVVVALSAAMLHDTGYIQREDEAEGTGARFGLVHEQRSIEFSRHFFRHLGVTAEEIEFVANLIRCTCFNEQVDRLPFAVPSDLMLGQMLASADLAGQIADRTYLEKLLFLYREFEEGQMGDYADEFDLLRRTLDFYSLVDERLRTRLGNVRRYFRPHFQLRWQIDDDLYASTIERNLDYLHYLLTHHPDDYREKLNRGGLIDQLEELESDSQLHSDSA